MLKNLIITLFFAIGTISTYANVIPPPTKSVLPRVFVLGEYEDQYNLLMQEYELSLLDVCDIDMMTAYRKLTSMYEEMEAYAEQINYNIKGVRLWLHVFWAEDGTIDHFGFHPHPNSRKIDADEFEAFLLGFINQYRFPLISSDKYALYTGISFPIFAKRVPNK